MDFVYNKLPYQSRLNFFVVFNLSQASAGFVSAWRYCGSLPQSRPQGFSLFQKKGNALRTRLPNANGMR
jgi:hypothetical protein